MALGLLCAGPARQSAWCTKEAAEPGCGHGGSKRLLVLRSKETASFLGIGDPAFVSSRMKATAQASRTEFLGSEVWCL